LVIGLVGCASIQESSELVLENAENAYERGVENIWVTPAGSVGTPAEAGAGQVLENAAGMVRAAGEAIWIPVEDVEEGDPEVLKGGSEPVQQAYEGSSYEARAQMKMPEPIAESEPQNIYTRDITPEIQY
jgi:hypothetical protein